MRKVLIFVLLAGSGLALLLWLESRREEPETQDRPLVGGEFPSQLPEESEFAEVPMETSDELQGEESVGVVVRGRLEVTYFDEQGRRHYTLVAEDTQHLGEGAYDLVKPFWTLYDVRTDEVTGELRASLGRAKLNLAGEGSAVDMDYPVTLQEVDATLTKGVPLVPLRFEVAVLEGVLSERRLSSREPVTITGRTLRADGVGLDVDEGQGLFVLREQGRAEIDLSDGTTARLAGLGPLILRETGQDGLVELESREEATLVFEGERQAQLSGDVIILRGSSPPGAEEEFLLSSVVAEGRASWTTLEGRFDGDRVVVSFDEAGLPLDAAVEGQPRGRLELVGLDEEDLPADLPEDQDSLDVELEGAGPLTLDLRSVEEGGGGFVLTGPGTMRVPDFSAVLFAQATIEGRREPGGELARMVARGGARGEMPDYVLEADELEAFARIEDGQTRSLSLEARGETTVTGTLRDGRGIVFLARGGMELLQPRGEPFRVPAAREVEIEVSGDSPLVGRAQRLLDFDGGTLAFEAQGDVVFEGAGGRGTGGRLVHRGGNAGELFGQGEVLGRFELESGSIQASSIEFHESGLVGRGNARAVWASPELQLEIDAGWIAVDRRLLSEEERASRPEGAPAAVAALVLRAGQDVTTRIAEATGETVVHSQELLADARELEPGQSAQGDLELVDVQARIDVETTYRGEMSFTGEGESLLLAGDRSGTLVAPPGERVRTRGSLPAQGVRFELEADEVEFARERVQATNPDVLMRGIDVRVSPTGTASEGGTMRAIAGRMDANPDSILFTEGVYLGRVEEEGELWSLDAAQALITVPPEEDQRFDDDGVMLGELLAWGGFLARFGPGLQAGGERLEISRATDKLKMWGSPAQVRAPASAWSSKSIEWDVATGFLRSTQGSVRALDPVTDEETGWTMYYESLEPREGPDTTVQVIRDPIFSNGERSVRADWAVVWIDSQEWSRYSRGLLGLDADARGRPRRIGDEPLLPSQEETRPTMPSLFGLVPEGPFMQWLQEIYLDGNIEFLVQGRRRGRAEAMYLDMIDRHGWLKQAVLTIDMDIAGEQRATALRTDWMRHSADGSLHAEDAELTSCDFEDPHFVVRTGELEIKPRIGDRGPFWVVFLRKNSVRLRHGPAMPLPMVSVPLDENYNIPPEEVSLFGVQPFSIGTSARFGAFIGTSFVRDLGSVAKAFDRFLRRILPGGKRGKESAEGGAAGEGGEGQATEDAMGPGGFTEVEGPEGGAGPGVSAVPRDQEATGRTRLGAALLGSRGALVDLGASFRSEGVYRFDTDTAVIYDTGTDRGLIRVPRSDRNDVRIWSRGEGRALIDDRQWLDFVYSVQTDAGVQSEFFEGDYLNYEMQETYLYWRRARSSSLASATAKVRTDKFRTQVQELPAGNYYKGRTQILDLGASSLLYANNSSVGYMSRLEGDDEPAFPDGQGDASSLRADTEHRLELPAEIGVFGLRATPFVSGRATAWSDGSGPGGAPTRLVAAAGLELTTAIWRVFRNGMLHQLSPTIGYRGNLALSETGSDPADFDRTEQSLEGKFLEFRVTSLLETPSKSASWDLELAATHAEELPDPADDGLQPIEINTTWRSYFGDSVLGFHLDGRYDVEDGTAKYSRTLFGLEPIPTFGFGAGYSVGRDDTATRLYDAVSLGAYWRLTKKYEVEGSQTISTLDNTDLNTNVFLRRFGHDFVIEVRFGFRAGEGGTFSFNVIPLFLWRRSGFSLVDRWRR